MSEDGLIDLNGSSIFSIAPVQFQTEINNIASLDVSNDFLVIGFKTGKLFRINLNDPAHIETIELPYKRSVMELGKIEKIFQDPTGNHLIVTTAKNESFYIHSKSRVFKHLNDLRGLKISAVGWNRDAITEKDTGPFLIGDKSGGIHEVFLEYHESTQKYNKNVLKNVYHTESSIDGIEMKYEVESNEMIILVVSGDDIMYWCQAIRKKKGKNSDLVLGTLMKAKPVEFEKYQDLGSIHGDKFSAYDLTIGWLTSAGVVFGSITKDRMETKSNFAELKFLLNIELPESTHKCKSIALTKYHLIVLRGNEILIINKLNDELVYQQAIPLSDDERLIGLSADYLKSTYWIYSNLCIYEISVTDEEKNIWRAMIETDDYEGALKTTDDPDIRDIIYSKQGEFFSKNGELLKAAKSFAHSSIAFETVSLNFLEKRSSDALLEYFLIKFSLLSLDEKFDFKMQKIMLSSWIVELFIEKLNDIDDLLTTEQASNLEATASLKTSIEKKFQDFLIDNRKVLDKKTIYEIITSHNRRSELLYYANLINDYDFVLAYWIRLENWKEALKIIERNNDPEMVSKYSTVLLVNAPVLTVDSWLRMDLDATKLLPSILSYNNNAKKVDPSKHQALRFLKGYVSKTKSNDASIHDALLYILISNEASVNEDQVLIYLEEYGNYVHYHPDFILRLCLRFKKIKSAAFIFSLLNFYEDAMNLALDNNIMELAIVIADKPDDEKTRRFLWNKVAKKRLANIRPSEKDKIKQEIKFLLDKCELLTIRDLLPYLPDFTTIDNLKDEICADLERFGTIINSLTLEMNSAIAINDSITKEIADSGEQHRIVKAGESCSLCGFLLTSRKFFIFPCNHAFHSDCLIKEILKSNDYASKKKVEFYQKKYLASKHEKNVKFINSHEVDELLSKRCPLCSDLQIETIDEPFTNGSPSKLGSADDWDI